MASGKEGGRARREAGAISIRPATSLGGAPSSAISTGTKAGGSRADGAASCCRQTKSWLACSP